MSLITEALSRWLPEALLARGDSRSAIRPPRAIDDARGSSNKAVPGGRLPAGESPGTIKTSVPGGRLAERESPGTIKSSAPDTINKGSSVGPLIAYHTLGEPVWAPRDYAAFAREGFMQNAIVYPWRGRITCHPAPGQSGSPDKTAAAATQIASFVGTAAVSDFSVSGTTVHYSGPAEWSYRRMVLHQAYLAKAAGGVEAFVIGTELRGLTWVRSAAGTYPFVTALVALAADVKSILGSRTKVLYAADWTEYFGHQPGDGSGDVYFHLDPLWSSPNIDAIGIDIYWPLADSRRNRRHHLSPSLFRPRRLQRVHPAAGAHAFRCCGQSRRRHRDPHAAAVRRRNGRR